MSFPPGPIRTAPQMPTTAYAEQMQTPPQEAGSEAGRSPDVAQILGRPDEGVYMRAGDPNSGPGQHQTFFS